MVVRGLFSFLISNDTKGVSKKMYLKEVANEWKAKNRFRQKPSLIIDGKCCLRLVYDENKKLDWLCQGQWREYIQNLQKFIEYIRSNGLEPVFYFDDCVQPSTRDRWIRRRKELLDRVQRIYSMLQSGENPDSPFDQYENWLIPPCIATLTPLLLKFQFDVEVYESFLEVDKEITSLAREKGPGGCVGILSSNTDYIIYDTNGVPFLLFEEPEVQMTKLVVFKCNQHSLASVLNISVNQLPILACLLGNDSIPFDAVKPFHKTFHIYQPSRPHYMWLLMTKIAALIHQPAMPLDCWERKVFGQVNGAFTTGVKVYKAILEATLETEKTFTGSPPLDAVEFKKWKITNTDPIDEERISLSLEHPELTKLTPAVIAFRTVRQRLMGLKGKKSVMEYCVYFGGNTDRGELVKALPSDVKIKQLHAPSVTSQLKWRVFCWIWSFPEALITSLKKLPANLQGITMLLYFIRKNIDVEVWEMEAIVRQACHLITFSGVPQLSKFGLPIPRGINFAALFLRGLQEMINSVLVCNFPIDLETVMPWKFFDGKLFQSIYKKLKNGESMPKLDKTGEAVMEIIFA